MPAKVVDLTLKYNPLFSALLLGVGIFALWRSINGVYFVENRAFAQWALGVFTMTIGGLSIFVPCAFISDKQIITYGFIPIFKRTYTFTSRSSLKLQDGALYVYAENGWTRVPIFQFLVRKKDWDTLELIVKG